MTAAPIAIIGIGCRFPGGVEDPNGFWKLVASGTDAIGDIPPDRWSVGDFYDADPATPRRTFVRQGGFLSGPIEEFDAGFFGMSPREAAALDPQQRVLLEVTWEAFEDAGIPPSTTAGADIGTYIGGFTFDAANLQLADANEHLLGVSTPAGVSMTMLSARLPYVFDWRGPCFTLDTACSSSLVAFHQACAALDRGDCDLAVAGGVNVMFHPAATIVMSKGQFLSPDARCKPFDHRANGYVRSEGAGVVVLKPLSAALRDGDHIRAVVRGTAVNHDGRTPGTAVPSADAQRALIRVACRTAGVDPRSVGYFEAHGTGTAVGDPLEATAIGDALADTGHRHWIGSVKSNIGHTEAAAGVAGVIKATLCLERGLIPPTLHFQRPNPSIPFDRLPLRVPTELVAFPDYDGPRRAGVNSFGAGGTNAHAILEQASPRTVEPAAADDGAPRLLPLSARGPEALRALADAYATLLERPDSPALHRICRAAARQRDHHPMRTSVVAADPAEAARRLRGLDLAPRRATRPAIAFVYTGMGPQWWGMGRELLENEPGFAEVVTACDRILQRYNISITEELLRDESLSRLTDTLYAQLANFVVQAGLTALWREWGIEPAVVVGHSVGEVAAAYVAGVYSLEDALTIAYHRASLQARLDGRGAMAAVGLPADEVAGHLVEGVEIAAINSATATTLAGDREALELVSKQLTATGVSVTALRVRVAYHSAHMDEIRAPLTAALAGIRPRPARIALVSTVTGAPVDGPELDASYWWHNVRRPVRFVDALRRVLGHAPGAVLEVGPHPVLAPAIDETLAEHQRTVPRLASLRRDRPQRAHLLETLGELYVAGAEPDWARVHPGPREHLDLPRYPWQRERHWVESTASRQARLGTGGPVLGGRAVAATTPTRDIGLSAAQVPYLADHRIGADMVFPGAAYVEAALAMFPDDEPCFLEDIVFHRPLVLPPSTVTTLRAGYDPARREVTLHGTTEFDQPHWTLYTDLRRAYVAAPQAPAARTHTLAEATRDLPEIGHDEVYACLSRGSLNYGPAFRAVEKLWCRAETGEVFAAVRLDTVRRDGHRLHPVFLDAALQAVFAGALLLGDPRQSGTYVPAAITELRFFRAPGRSLWIHGRDRRGSTPGRFDCDLTLITDDGEIVAEITGLHAQRLAEDTGRDYSERLYYEHAWVAEDSGHKHAGMMDGTWILVGSSAIADELGQRLGDSGAEVVRTSPLESDWLERVAAGLASESGCRAVVYVGGSELGDGPVCTPVAAALRLVQALPAAGVPLFLVTVGTQSVSAAEATIDPFAAALWGFGRVVNAERPELRCRLIDLAPDARDVDALLGELLHDGLDEVALRSEGRYVRRIEPAPSLSPMHQVTIRTDRTPVHLGVHRTAVDTLRFAATERRAPGPSEVEIEIGHVGVNFKDVLKVTGLLAPQAMAGSHSGEALGLECSGTVARVGAEVTDLRVGDSVFAHSRDLFASHVTLEAIRVVRAPAGLSGAEAASLLPVVTAHEALVRLAAVRPGDRVLVHSAAGGVGLAAVRIARLLGAQVYATAGSRTRREFLRDEGIEYVADSRSTSFADDVLRWTGGEGVDVIVNSLPPDMIRANLRVLRTFGRFVELGKPADADDSIRLASARRALSFHSFDYDQMMALAPQRVRDAMRQVADLYGERAIAPLPVTVVPAEQVDKAFLAMGGPDHIGKIVVHLADEPVTVPASSMPGSPIRSDATYVLTGGLGGLGRTVARWLADRGARHLVLIGRRGIATAAAERAVTDLTAAGVDVRVERADVADREQVAAVLRRIREQSPPIRGIVHAAADFDDVVLADTDPHRLLTATRPKADGAWNLHRETEHDVLDFFVLFSSVGSQLGSAGLGAYATANEFLDALARYRHARGLPATSVGWGMIDEVGVAVSGAGEVGEYLRRSGHLGIAPARLLTELETLLRTRPVEVSVADIDWRRWARANPQLASLPRFDTVAPADAADGAGESLAALRLREVDPAERVALLTPLLAPLLAQTTGLTEHELGDEHPIDIDSLTAVGLRVLLQKELGVSVPAVKLQTNLTMTGLADLLAAEVDRAPADTLRLAADLTVHEFESADGLIVYGHLGLPPGPGPHPAVVVCTAGAGGALDESGDYARIDEHAPLRAAGFAVFTVDHRGAPGHGDDFTARAELGDGDIDDIVAAARYLAARPEIDGDRIGILGTSRGAYSALTALERDEFRWHRAVLLMGLFDPAHLVESERARPGSFLPPRPGVGPDEIAAHFAAPHRQPLTALHRVTTSLLAVHGDADTVVPVEQSRELAARATQSGLSVRLRIVPGLGHDLGFAGPDWAELWPVITEFLRGDE